MTTKHEIKKSINSIIREKGRFPTLQDMCNALDFSESQTKNYMYALYEDGYLEKIGDWYRFPEPTFKIEPSKEEVADNFNILEDVKVLEQPKKKRGRPPGTTKEKIAQKKEIVKEKTIRPIYDVQIWIIQSIMAIIGVGASIISIYYTSIWLIEFLPIVFAVLLSSIMTAFSVSAFETVILFLSGEITDSQWVKTSAVAGFATLWIIVTFFSIMSTVAGQVNEDFKKKAQVESKIDYNEKQRWAILQEEKKDLQERLSEYRDQQKIYRDILSGLNTVEKREENKAAWWDINNKIRINQNNTEKVLKEIDVVRSKERDILSKSKSAGPITGETVGTTDFYQWLSKVIGVTANRIQFLLVLLPAVFCDVIAPVGIAVTLFLRSKNI